MIDDDKIIYKKGNKMKIGDARLATHSTSTNDY